MIYLITLTIFLLSLMGLLIAIYYRYKNNCHIAKEFINSFLFINIISFLLFFIFTIKLIDDVNIINNFKVRLIIKNQLTKEEEIAINRNILIYESCILDGIVVKKLSIKLNQNEKQ